MSKPKPPKITRCTPILAPFTKVINKITETFNYAKERRGGGSSDRNSNEVIAATVRDVSKMMGKKVAILQKTSGNVKGDITTVALGRSVDIVLLGEGPDGHTVERQNLTGADKRELIFGGDKVSYILEHATVGCNGSYCAFSRGWSFN